MVSVQRFKIVWFGTGCTKMPLGYSIQVRMSRRWNEDIDFADIFMGINM